MLEEDPAAYPHIFFGPVIHMRNVTAKWAAHCSPSYVHCWNYERAVILPGKRCCNMAFTAALPWNNYKKIRELLHMYVGYEVLTAVIMNSLDFWDMTPCSLLKYNRCFGGTCRLHFQGRRIRQAINQSESWGQTGDYIFLRNVGWLPTDYTALYSRTRSSFLRNSPSKLLKSENNRLRREWQNGTSYYLYPLTLLISWDWTSQYEICSYLFTHWKSLPNFCHHQIMVSITVCCPERSEIKYTWIPSPCHWKGTNYK
jgi:hypothetical protein